MYSIMLEHVALFPGPSKNNGPVDEAIDHSSNNMYNDYPHVRVFHPNASSYRSMSLQAAFRHHKQAKKRKYRGCVHEVEHGVFTPLVLFTT